GPKHSLSRDLALLYRLALEMGAAETLQDLAGVVLEGLLEATPAEVGAILLVARAPGGDGTQLGTERPHRPERGTPQRSLEVPAFRHRDASAKSYNRVSDYVSTEVMATREAILAEDVARDRYLKNRESLSDIGATSLICAPILFGEKVLGVIHLYCTDPHKA